MRARDPLTSLSILARAGIIQPMWPHTLVRLGRTVATWGTGPAGGFGAVAVRDPRRTAIVDELGELTYAEVHHRSNSIARGLAESGVSSHSTVALLCRNHRGFIEAMVATAKLGADLVLLNTSFSGPQLRAVIEESEPTVIVHDAEFSAALGDAPGARVLGWTDADDDGQTLTLDGLARTFDSGELQPPPEQSRMVILTSGTTGTPKGAPRGPAGVGAAVAMLSRLPLREGWRTHIAAPMFHTWGYAHLMLAMLLGSTMVLRRTFDPHRALEVLESERCDSFVVIPVMLQRILALDESDLDQHTLDQLKVVASSGSALPGQLSTRWMDRFGDNLYNIFGSTEVAYASIATPDDLRASPGCAGKPPHGTTVRILDDAGVEVAAGTTGRIFVGNGMLFEGYTDGASKEVVDGLMSIGDLGHLDADGRLHVTGRDDEMIVSGGENVFPHEVETCLATHPGVHDVAAVAVDDEDFGTRLRAFVVRDPRAEGSVEEDELKAWVHDNLARFKVPREIVFLPELPRNGTGKVLKRDLATWTGSGPGASA